MISQEQLKKLYKYDEYTGKFTRLVRTGRFNIGTKVGSIQSTGYIHIAINKKTYKAHRLAWLYMHGKMPTNFIDHKNENRSDNRIINLCEATRCQNQQNRGPTKRNTTGHKGVSFARDRNKFTAQIGINKQKIRLGYFDDIKDAIKARKAAEVKYGWNNHHSA